MFGQHGLVALALLLGVHEAVAVQDGGAHHRVVHGLALAELKHLFTKYTYLALEAICLMWDHIKHVYVNY